MTADDSTPTPSTVDLTRPARRDGVRTRAGNGMSRSRSSILEGAARCVARHGTRKTTMGDIAREGGVAKATLYNHFRTKDDVYSALLESEVESLLAIVRGVASPAGSAEVVQEALTAVASWLSEHPVVRHLADSEPALAAALMTPSDAASWRAVRSEAMRCLTLAQAAGALHAQHDADAAVDTIIRWAASHVLWPAKPAATAAGAAQLVAALRVGPARAADPADDERRAFSVHSAG
jgi:AcrR family transcriptional regulator